MGFLYCKDAGEESVSEDTHTKSLGMLELVSFRLPCAMSARVLMWRSSHLHEESLWKTRREILSLVLP